MNVAEAGRKGSTGVRAGAHALSLLTPPLNVHILEALADGPRPLVDLRRATGSPPQTTMRGHLRALSDQNILVRRREHGFPGAVDYELCPPGRRLLGVAKVVQTWLSTSPEGPIVLGSPAAKSAVRALVDGWSAGVIRALAGRPLTLTELSRLISSISYPSLERRLAAMRLAGLIERRPGGGRGTPYAITEWLRRAIVPIGSAAIWERQNAPSATNPIQRLDVEAAFLLAVPLLELPAELSGRCRMVIESRDGGGSKLAGATVGVKDGMVATCVARLDGDVDAWASGSLLLWLRALLERDSAALDVRGDRALAEALIHGLRRGLLRAHQPA